MILSQNAGGGVSSYLWKNKKWFTLVELIIVVVIIGILATIAFLTLWNYTSQARDARRFSDKNNIEKALEIYRAEKWEYPDFDEEDGKIVFWTWAWEKVNTSLSTLPRDPLTNKFYRIELANNLDKIDFARVVLELETSNNKLSQNNIAHKNQDNKLDEELKNLKNQLKLRVSVLEWIDKTNKTEESINNFNTKVNSWKSLLEKPNVTKEELKNKIKELENLENTLENVDLNEDWNCPKGSYMYGNECLEYTPFRFFEEFTEKNGNISLVFTQEWYNLGWNCGFGYLVWKSAKGYGMMIMLAPRDFIFYYLFNDDYHDLAVERLHSINTRIPDSNKYYIGYFLQYLSNNPNFIIKEKNSKIFEGLDLEKIKKLPYDERIEKMWELEERIDNYILEFKKYVNKNRNNLSNYDIKISELYFDILDWKDTRNNPIWNDFKIRERIVPKKVIVPKYYFFRKVTSIYWGSYGEIDWYCEIDGFIKRWIEEIYLPDSIEEIWDSAFFDTPTLKKIHLPSKLKSKYWNYFWSLPNWETNEKLRRWSKNIQVIWY